MTDEERPRILIVDDERGTVRGLQLALAGPSWETDIVHSGEAAMERFEPGRYQLALVDNDLPDTTGVDLIRRLRDGDGRLRILMMTRHASTRSAIDAANLGIDAYLEKPFRNIFAVRDLVQATLARGPADFVRLARSTADTAVQELDTTRALQEQSAKLSSPPEGSAEAKPAVKLLVAVANDHAHRAIRSRDAELRVDTVFATTPAELAEALVDDAVAGILVHDSFELVDTIIGVQARRPDLRTFVFSERLGVRTVTELINLGVSGIIDAPPISEEFANHLSRIGSALRVDRRF